MGSEAIPLCVPGLFVAEEGKPSATAAHKRASPSGEASNPEPERTISREAGTVVWEPWQKPVLDWLPAIHGHRKNTRALRVLGIVLSPRAVLPRMAARLSRHGIRAAKRPRSERRLARFMAQEGVQGSTIWEDVLAHLLPVWQGQALQFVLDGTPREDRAILVEVGLLVPARVVPIAWRVRPAHASWNQGPWEVMGEFLDAVQPWLEPTDGTLMAERGLAGLPLGKRGRDRKWPYLVRVCQEHPCRRGRAGGWKPWTPVGHSILKEGQPGLGRLRLWPGPPTIDTQASWLWEEGYKAAWVLF